MGSTCSPAIVSDDFIAKSLGMDPKVMNPELEKAGKSYPLGRLATVEDIANCILYLSSNDSAFVTGNICDVCKRVYFWLIALLSFSKLYL